MATVDRSPGSWLSATLRVLLAVLGFSIVWYPSVSLGNAVLGSPASAPAVDLIVGTLALGGAYPVVAGDWSLGALAEYVCLLLGSAIAWGLLGMALLLATGVEVAGSNPAPQAVVWGLAYPTAAAVAGRTGRPESR